MNNNAGGATPMQNYSTPQLKTAFFEFRATLYQGDAHRDLAYRLVCDELENRLTDAQFDRLLAQAEAKEATAC